MTLDNWMEEEATQTPVMCRNCYFNWEARHLISTPKHKLQCPKCGQSGKTAERLIPNVRFEVALTTGSDDELPWESGYLNCNECSYLWWQISKWPIIRKTLSCPKCHCQDNREVSLDLTHDVDKILEELE